MLEAPSRERKEIYPGLEPSAQDRHGTDPEEATEVLQRLELLWSQAGELEVTSLEWRKLQGGLRAPSIISRGLTRKIEINLLAGPAAIREGKVVLK